MKVHYHFRYQEAMPLRSTGHGDAEAPPISGHGALQHITSRRSSRTDCSKRLLSILDVSPVKTLKILLSAYACEPNQGSEPGLGWNVAREVAKHYEVWVLTPEEHRPAIEAELALNLTTGRLLKMLVGGVRADRGRLATFYRSNNYENRYRFGRPTAMTET